MISIAELQDIADKEKTVEKEAAKVKYAKDLAIYRDRIQKIHSNIMSHIQEQILLAMKINRNYAGLYLDDFKKIFASVNKHDSGEILCYMLDENREPSSAYRKALQEEAKTIRKEFAQAGIKKIARGGQYMGDPYIRIYF